MSEPLLRSPWFWIAITLIVAGIGLTAALGVLYWLIAALATAVLVLIAVFLVAAYAVGRVEPPRVPRLRKVPPSERIPVIYDCDVTMGRPFRDVSDGLALLYLLGETCVDLLCVTTTYGNSPVDVTTRTVRHLLHRLGYDDVATLPGAAGPNEEPEMNRAARFLTTIVDNRPGEVALIATGSASNLKHAAALDPDFFKKLRGLYLLGGATGPLVWNGHRLAELNFSLDPQAAYLAIHADCPVTIATGQAGLTAVFRSPQFATLQALGDPVSRLIVRKTRFWFALMRLWFRDDGFAMWASVAALPLTHPELFEYEQVYVTSTLDDLRTGRLVVDPSEHGPVRLIRGVRDFDGFILAHFAAWRHLWRRVSAKKQWRRKTSK
ncbi:MAG TPA: nucleoside hydrolase [Thermoflexia bacterium]|nr:nucleoside hydrolase [Thermoflexia bacterium]